MISKSYKKWGENSSLFVEQWRERFIKNDKDEIGAKMPHRLRDSGLRDSETPHNGG